MSGRGEEARRAPAGVARSVRARYRPCDIPSERRVHHALSTSTVRPVFPAALVLAASLSGGCFRTDLAPWEPEVLPFEPQVGAPEGWLVQDFQMPLVCPDGEPARAWWVYPESAAAPEGQQAILMPLVILFHSGSFDYVFEPNAAYPTAGLSYAESIEEEKRLSSTWAAERVYATLGMYPNDSGAEFHTGALPAALAEKGFAMLLPQNCWGDWWHNRSSVTQNDFPSDFFFRDGRTSAEFAWLHATTAFPPGNPVPHPFGIDTERIYLVGLGEGARAATELINLREDNNGTPGAFLYQPAGMVLDSPSDDLRPYYNIASPENEVVKAGLTRVFGGPDKMLLGSLGGTPLFGIPTRTALLASANDGRLPPNTNNLAKTQLSRLGAPNTWLYEGTELAHVLTNADVELAKVVADYLADGLSAVPAAYQTPLSAPP
jgi:hypothetical protein